jgi:hypothetical protein
MRRPRSDEVPAEASPPPTTDSPSPASSSWKSCSTGDSPWRINFGIDSVIGLVPVVGSLITGALGF